MSDLTTTRPVPKAAVVTDTGTDITAGPAETFNQATGNTDSTQLSASIGGGRDFINGEMTLTPYGRLDYTRISIDGYEETVHRSSEGIRLRVNEQDVDSLMGSAGVRASRAVRTASGNVFVPQASIELGHEFANDARDIVAVLPVADDVANIRPVSVRTSDPDRDHIKLGVGVSAVFSKGRSGFVHVESIQGNDQYSDTAVKFGYRMEF